MIEFVNNCDSLYMNKLCEFIKLANEKHNYKYSYDKSVYIKRKAKLIITCPKHGDFEQIADNHLRGNGCPVCSGKKLLTNQEFIEKARKIHGDKFDYSKVEYVNNKQKVYIVCREHGIFEQKPGNHLSGFGCSKCAKNIKLLTEEFIKISNDLHKGKYRYEKSNYLSNKSKIIITCLDHGDFEILSSNHLRGTGCSKCSSKYKPTNSEFISKCQKIHNNKYDYSNVIYNNNRKKIDIICPSHGVFNQRPSHHLNGIGCPNCQQSSGEQIIENFFRNNSINFKFQFSFEDLKLKKHLRFDFAIFNKNNNMIYLLEYNGIQHYELRERFHKSQEEYLDSKKRDELKKEYCKKNNIPLHIIKYDEDIIESLTKILNHYESKQNC